MAEILGISRDHLAHIEIGVKAPSVDLLIVMSEYFGMSLDYIGKLANTYILSRKRHPLEIHLLILSQKKFRMSFQVLKDSIVVDYIG